MMRKILDMAGLLLVAGFSFFYVTNEPFRDAVIAEARMIEARPIAENARMVPFELKRAVVGGCPVPLTYRIGTIDPRFGMARDQVLAQAMAAAKEWNDAAGAELLTYQSDGVMPVSLVYDDRQALSLQIHSETDTLKTQEEKIAFAQKKYDTEKVTLEQKKRDYGTQEKRYTKALSNFEDRVRSYEASGTYDESTQDDLQKERKRVQDMYKDLESARQSLNDSVDMVNTLAKGANLLKDSFNAHVDTYNTSVGEKRSMNEDYAGVYFSDRHIEVYQFLNSDDLRAVLIHEMGHALGFDHSASDPQSIMYPTAGDGQIMTAADKQLARNLCK
jgi:hypothetical protein